MHHVAIMKKSWGLLPKILAGKKIIESRWYLTRHKPWNTITPGDTIYFKNSGEPISARAEIKKVLQLEDLTPIKIKGILKEYGRQDGLSPTEIPTFYQLFKTKKYCLLIFLKNPRRIRPFKVNKAGFGAMAAWITVPNITKIKQPTHG